VPKPTVGDWNTTIRGGRTGQVVRDSIRVRPAGRWTVHVQRKAPGSSTWRTHQTLRTASNGRLTVSLPVRSGTWSWRLSVTTAGLKTPVRTSARTLVGSSAPCVWGKRNIAAAPAGSGSGKRIVWKKSARQVWLVNADGSIRCSYPVTSLEWKTPAGTYRVRSKSRVSRAHQWYLDDMVRFHRRPGQTAWIGFHAVPYDAAGRRIMPISKLGQPGYASAGCVRQHPTNAHTLYAFAPVGTKVVVI
jgi:hypothetical protein